MGENKFVIGENMSSSLNIYFDTAATSSKSIGQANRCVLLKNDGVLLH